MASIFVHLSIGFLAYVFPDIFFFVPLAIASVFPDIEYFLIAVYGLIKNKDIRLSTELVANTGILHSIFGSVLISFPICFALSVLFSPVVDYAVITISVIAGLLSHLLLDLPAHPNLMLLWPFKKYKKNPFLIKKTIPAIKSIYPYKWFETRPYQYISEFHWSVLSLLIPIIILLLIIF